MNNISSEISKAAAALGKKGGSVKSEAKTRAARENGKKGGRPRTIRVVALNANIKVDGGKENEKSNH